MSSDWKTPEIMQALREWHAASDPGNRGATYARQWLLANYQILVTPGQMSGAMFRAGITDTSPDARKIARSGSREIQGMNWCKPNHPPMLTDNSMRRERRILATQADAWNDKLWRERKGEEPDLVPQPGQQPSARATGINSALASQRQREALAARSARLGLDDADSLDADGVPRTDNAIQRRRVQAEQLIQQRREVGRQRADEIRRFTATMATVVGPAPRCQFALNRDAPFKFCDEPTVERTSWCEHHIHRVFDKHGTPRLFTSPY